MKYYVSFKVNSTGNLRGMYVNASRPTQDSLTDAVIDELGLNPRNVDYIQFFEVKENGVNKIDISSW